MTKRTERAPIPDLEPGRFPGPQEKAAVRARIVDQCKRWNLGPGLIDYIDQSEGVGEMLQLIYMLGYADGAVVEDRKIAAAIDRGEWIRPV